MFIKKKCNVFIPRNIYSLFLVLSKKKSDQNDDYIIINSHDTYAYEIPMDIIKFLKKKKFKIIYTDKAYTFKNLKKLQNTFINRLFKINYIKNFNKICHEILKKKHEEFSDINFYNYENVNIYYGSNVLYYSNICKKFKNVNLIFLEHGAGNFLTMMHDIYMHKNKFKQFFVNIIKSIIFKIKGVYIPKDIYYFGIYGHVFDVKKLEYDNHRISFLRLDFEKGFDQLFKFYEKKLKNLKTNKKKCYIFFNIPYHYDLKTYKKYLDYNCASVKFKKNIVILIKIHDGYYENPYLNLLCEILDSKKIKYQLLSKKYTSIPVEIIIKHFNVKEIYSGYSSILFSSFYLFKGSIKINAVFSSSINKNVENLIELNKFTIEYIKKKYINKNTNFIDLDLNK